ncbi:MAG: hypothetical protein QF749_02630 [Verrucomicrobiota bacterium]|nr:hypothetical protein [Verrucomicrobiota bacterium]MDP6250745.1 hypothetical protein [Verrucomicrobiota bacterium]MDP7177163.1 hypothetical protein [Verrucomicrobiota bacterium]MDP7291617.1 hypothetical protein [Verrucomicrobiota bacterium]
MEPSIWDVSKNASPEAGTLDGILMADGNGAGLRDHSSNLPRNKPTNPQLFKQLVCGDEGTLWRKANQLYITIGYQQPKGGRIIAADPDKLL